MLGGVLDRARQPQELHMVDTFCRDDIDELHPAGGDRAGFVQHDRVDDPGGLQHLRALDQDTDLGTPAGADQQRRRRGQAQRARAGNDQDRNRGGERRRRAVPCQQPPGQCCQGQRDDDRHEDRRHSVREPLHLRLAVLGVLDELGHLRQLGVGTDAGSADHELPAGVHGRAHDGVPWADLDRDRLPGQHGGVDRGRPGLHDTVGGDLLTGSHDEHVPDGELADRDAHLAGRRWAVPKDGDVLRAYVEQGAQRGPGLPLRACLKVTAGQDERGDRGGDLKVDVRLVVARAR